ncbi:MAG TPA: LacI family DNA-binding transcriptional regulator [Anaerolineales bacterium]|nr:LacI family DNA-binding transcriptional regulator [Anaerolineales bacterium]
MSSRATISDVASKAGVSISTVSRVLNNTVPVDQETALRVRTAVEELNYTPHSAARTLASRKTNTIGLLLLDIGGEFYTPLLRGIEAVSSQAGYDLLIHSTITSMSGTVSRRALGEHNTDGLLVFTDALDHAELARLQSISFPVVLMHQSSPKDLAIPVITIENQSGAQKVVDHLIERHGCKRILYLQGPEGNEDSEQRERGYRQSLRKHGLPFDPSLVARGGFETNRAHAVVAQLLAAGLVFDGIFTGDDDNAVGVIQALREAGRDIPRDVAVAGFDDSLFARILTPPLTSVRAPIEQVGQAAVRQLLRLIRAEQVEARLVLPTELIIRQSCGCPK